MFADGAIRPPRQAQRLRPKPRGAAIPNAKLSDFARLMGASTAAVEETPAYELIKQIVRPYVQPAASPDQAGLVATVDTALTAMMRRLLHHPDFQTLEGLWRTVDLLVRELETDEKLQVILYDITAEEVAADLASSDDLSHTGLYQLFVEQPALDLRTVPPSAIIGNYTFQQTPPHADLLGRMAKIAAAAQAPFVAGIETDAFDRKKPEDIHPLVAQSWATLRALPHAAYLGLAVPRFMLRWPYGTKTEPIDPFPFEEFTEHFGLKGFLWGHSANLVGIMLAKTFAEQGMGGMQLGSIMVQGDLPLYYYVDRDGDQMALPCTERLASESVAAYAASQGFMPVVWMRGRPEVRLTTLSGLNSAPLAGPWAPVEMPAETAAPPAAAAPAPAAPPAPALPEEPELDDEPAAAAPSAAEPEPVAVEPPPASVAEDDSDADELDDLLSQLEDDVPAAEPPQQEASSEGDSDDEDDLDALLASIEGDAEIDDEDAESDEMDPELAALLADL